MVIPSWRLSTEAAEVARIAGPGPLALIDRKLLDGPLGIGGLLLEEAVKSPLPP